MTCEICATEHTTIQATAGGTVELCAIHAREMVELYHWHPEAIRKYRLTQAYWHKAAGPFPVTDENLSTLWDEYTEAEIVCFDILRDWIDGYKT